MLVAEVVGDGRFGRANGEQVKELIYCAFDTAATHMYQPGLKLHMQNVLNYGGTAEEIMEVMELATLLSISTMDAGLEVLEKELA